jgi:hypothetical protein
MRVHKANPPSGNPVVLSAPRAAQLFHFSKRVTCRLAGSHVERDAIFKLRYRSYLRAGLISQNSFGRFLERADHAANTYLMGLYVDRKLVSSLRLQIGSPTTPGFSSLELFSNVLEPLRRSNKTVVDLSCVATDGEFARQSRTPHRSNNLLVSNCISSKSLPKRSSNNSRSSRSPIRRTSRRGLMRKTICWKRPVGRTRVRKTGAQSLGRLSITTVSTVFPKGTWLHTIRTIRP